MSVRFEVIFRNPSAKTTFIHSFINSFIPLTCAECDDSLPFSGASSIPLCYVPFPATLLHLPSSFTSFAIYFLVCLSVLFFPNSYIILFWEFNFLPFSAHARNNVIYLTYCLSYGSFLTLA